MAFLRLKDYERSIQLTELTQLTAAGGDSVRVNNELATIEEVKSYLRQRYDVSDEFRDTVVYDPTKSYVGNQLVELNASAWSNATPYVVNNVVLVSGKVYVSIQNGTNQPPATSPLFWTLLGSQYDLFFVSPPYAEFDNYALYNIGDIVWWKNKVYKALKPTYTLDEQTQIQYLQYGNVPNQNVFPDDPNNGKTTWGTGVLFSLSSLFPSALPSDYTAWSSATTYTGTEKVSYGGAIYQSLAASTDVKPGTDISKWVVVSWTAGDNRNQKIVEVCVDISLYKINKQIAPRNVTQTRIDANDLGIQWLDMTRKGQIDTDIPVLQPAQGRRIRYGGNIKLQNNY